MRVPPAFFRWTMREYLDVVDHMRLARLSRAVADSARDRQRKTFDRAEQFVRLAAKYNKEYGPFVPNFKQWWLRWIQHVWVRDPSRPATRCRPMRIAPNVYEWGMSGLLTLMCHIAEGANLSVDLFLPRETDEFYYIIGGAEPIGERPEFDTGRWHEVMGGRLRFTSLALPKDIDRSDVRCVARGACGQPCSSCVHFHNGSSMEDTRYERCVLKYLEDQMESYS